MGKKKIRNLKKKLNKLIISYGRDSPRVLEVSQKLDIYIVKEMIRRNKKGHKNYGKNL